VAVKRITRRWLLNNFGVIIIIIIIIEAAFAFGITNYYYNSVEQALESRADVANSMFAQYSNDSRVDFSSQVRDYVAGFSAKDKMEMMTIDQSGAVALTSSGFSPENPRDLPDYEIAKASPERSGRYVGRWSGGEHIMAVTVIFPMEEEPVAAVRFVTSLTNVDRQIALLVLSMVLLGVVVLIPILFSSSYFIGTIVNPVGEVGETARRIAQGDFEARLTKRTDDEIGELCDIINYMAGELSNAEKIKNDFISSVSHELRTPLTAIQGWGETILGDGGQDKETLRRGMNVIISETTRLSGMVEELLDFSRMESGRLTLVRSKIDVMAELSEAVMMYTERARREDIAIHFEESEQIAPVNGDKNKLRQVFVNILDNAIKYSDPGDTVTILANIDNQTLTITVADTGIGVKEEDLPKIKTKFYKADFTRRGSGIGLAVAEEIVVRHEGTLAVDSVYGKGTTVTITLPIYTKQDEIAQIDNPTGTEETPRPGGEAQKGK